MAENAVKIAGSFLKYLILIFIIIAVGIVFLKISLFLGEFLIFFAVAMFIGMFGSIAQNTGHRLSAILFKRILSWIPISLFAGFFIYAIVVTKIGTFLATGAEISAFLFLTSLSLLYGASSVREIKGRVNFSRFIGKFSRTFLFLSLYFALFLAYPYQYAGYPFLFAAIGNIPFSFGPILLGARTKSIRELGIYVTQSYGSYLTGFFLLGLVATLLDIPKPPQFNQFILFFLILGIVVMMFFAFWRWYSIGSGRLESMYNSAYEAHRHTSRLISEETIDILSNSVKEFVVSGRKGNLLVVLAHMLGAGDAGIEETLDILKRLNDYGGSDTTILNMAFTRKAIESEITARMDIVNSIATVIRKRLEE